MVSVKKTVKRAGVGWCAGHACLRLVLVRIGFAAIEVGLILMGCSYLESLGALEVRLAD